MDGYTGKLNVAKSDFKFQISAGEIPGIKSVHKFGRNGGIGTSWEDVWLNGGIYSWPTSPATLEAISSDADDSSTGAGAQQLTIEGLDINFLPITSTIEMNGLSASSPTEELFFRVNRVYVSRTGTYSNTDNGPNQGVITIRFSGAGATQCLIGADGTVGMGQTAIARYTTSRNSVGYLFNILLQVDSSKNVQAILWRRLNAQDVTAPFSGAKRMIFHLDGESGSIEFPLSIPLKIPQMTDIWFSMKASVGSAGSVDFAIALVDNP